MSDNSFSGGHLYDCDSCRAYVDAREEYKKDWAGWQLMLDKARGLI